VLGDAVARHAPELSFSHLRAPQAGMVMLRGRCGGSGDPFNLGEATVSRCTVKLADGRIGSGHVLGRDTRKAELVALLDGLMQDEGLRHVLDETLVRPQAAEQALARTASSAQAAATQVAFYTMVRGA